MRRDGSKLGWMTLALLLALAVPLHAVAQENDEDGGRVIGGRKAEVGEWPWQVKILAPDSEQRGRYAGHCGGSLIAPRWILTAAHCLSSGRAGQQDLFARDLLIVEGKTKMDRVVSVIGDDKVGIKVEGAMVHEGFDRKTFSNDIALIHLAKPAVSKTASLAGPADAPLEKEGGRAIVTGWGYTKADHGWDEKYLPTELQEVELPLVSLDACRAGYRETSMRLNPIDQRNLCAGYRDGGKDACQGDSGGPLVAKRPDGSFAQLGVVSWGAGCAEAEHYGVYTRVSAFRGWIAEKTKGEIPADGPATTPQVTTMASQAVQPPKLPVLPQTSAESQAVPPLPVIRPQPATELSALGDGGAAVSENAAGKPGDRALIVGIDDYAIPEARLKGSVADAEAIRTLLVRTYGFKPEQIRTLINRQASREAILAAIDDVLVRESTAGGRVIFYFAGQGSQESGDTVSSPTLVAADARIERKDKGAISVTGQIRETEIAARLNALKDRQVTLIIDACHVGPGARNAAGMPAGKQVRCLGPALASLKPPAQPMRPARFSFGGELATVWSAVDAGQWAPVEETAQGSGGVFTRLFIDGIKGGAGRSEGAPSSGVSNAALLDFVRRKTAEYCAVQAGQCRFGLLPQFYAPDDALGRDVVSGEPAKTPIAAVQNTLKNDNALGVSVDILPGAALKVGEKVAMRAATVKPGYLILIDVDAAGKLTQLYPNRRSMGLKATVKTADNRLDPARPVIVPDAANPYVGFEYVVEGPPGVGMVVAVLSEKPVEVFDLPDVPTALVGQRAAMNYVYDLARSLRIVGEGDGEKSEWSFDAKFYRVQ
jgi:secreted trypsin-like serine protease